MDPFLYSTSTLCHTGSLTNGDTMDRAQVMNLVSAGVHEYLQAYQPLSNQFAGPQYSSQVEPTPAQVPTDETSQHTNLTVSDTTLQTM